MPWPDREGRVGLLEVLIVVLFLGSIMAGLELPFPFSMVYGPKRAESDLPLFPSLLPVRSSSPVSSSTPAPSSPPISQSITSKYNLDRLAQLFGGDPSHTSAPADSVQSTQRGTVEERFQFSMLSLKINDGSGSYLKEEFDRYMEQREILSQGMLSFEEWAVGRQEAPNRLAWDYDLYLMRGGVDTED